MVENDPRTKIDILLSRMQITVGDTKIGFEIKREQLYALLNGSWDSLFLLDKSREKSKQIIQSLPYVRLLMSKSNNNNQK